MRLSPVIRWSTRAAAGLVLALLVVGPAAAGPARTSAQGKSLDELLGMWMTWALGGDQADHFKKVRFMPLPAGELVGGSGTADDPFVYQGETDVTLKAGTSFVMPVAAWTREVYEDGHTDPALDDSVFTESNVLVTIDGKPVLDSRRHDLSRFYVPPTALDPAVMYDEPTDYGSVGTVGFQGLGFVHGPLSVGEHTMTLHSEIIDPETGIAVVYENTWNITVTR